MQPAGVNDPVATLVPRLLRLGVAMCYIGHGAFGILTKHAWLPFFGVVGIPEESAKKLMPWVGSMDVMMGFLVLFWPCRALYLWAAGWAVWTALLRPLAGQGWPEFFERAGNYGVPLALLAAHGLGALWQRLPDTFDHISVSGFRRMSLVLRFATATLLLGHGHCALLLAKPALQHHYDALGFTDTLLAMKLAGSIDIALGLIALFARHPAWFVAAAGWKLASEGLFLSSGAQAAMFEVIERGGSYVAPLALAVWLRHHQMSKSPTAEEATARA